MLSDSRADENGQQAIWMAPPAEPLPAEDVVHVWRVDLDAPPAVVDHLMAFLDPDEQQRALRFSSPDDRRHFTLCRGALRDILARYLRTTPTSIRFCYGREGKPALLTERMPHPLRFNVSHAHNLALIGVAYNRDIGVDIEYLLPNTDCQRIAQRWFTPRDYTPSAQTPEPRHPAAFYSWWTRQEAYLKGLGLGQPAPSSGLECPHLRDEMEHFLKEAEPGYWTLHDLDADPSYTAALAVEGQGWSLACWEWQTA